MSKLRTSIAFAILVGMVAPGMAGEADVENVTATKSGSGWTFNVTVRHDDTGWDHYADKWEVVGPDGVVLGTRTLAHPHENEQPFTRSLSGVVIPDGVTSVTIRAGDSVHGLGGKEIVFELPNS